MLSVRPQTALSEFVAGTWVPQCPLQSLCSGWSAPHCVILPPFMVTETIAHLSAEAVQCVCPQWASAWALGPIHTLRIHSGTNDQPDTSHFPVRVELFLLLLFFAHCSCHWRNQNLSFSWLCNYFFYLFIFLHWLNLESWEKAQLHVLGQLQSIAIQDESQGC